MMMIIIYKVNCFDYDHHQYIIEPCFIGGGQHESVKRAGPGEPDAHS